MSTPEPPRSLVVLSPNWLGDAIMALPLLADLRRGWPTTHIVVAAREAVAPLFAMVPVVDETVTVDGGILKGSHDAALLLPNSFASALLVWRSGVKERWGFARDFRRPLLTRAIRPPHQYGHQVEYYQSLATALGLPTGPPFAGIHVPPQAQSAALQLLREAGATPGQPFAVFAPGAAYGRAKQWQPARFAELASLMAADGAEIVVVGAKGDIAACEEVARLTPAVNLAGRTDLPTLAGVLSQARDDIANDSGAMHLAAAAGARVTALFGPTNERKTSPLRAGAEAPTATIVASQVWCRPCMLRECPIDHRCMAQISAQQVRGVTQL